MNSQWTQSGNNFFSNEVSNNIKNLPAAIYKIEQLPNGTLFLAQVQDKYEFPYKIYGMESKFIERVIKTYKQTVGNLGVLLNGVKGTGKTVTVKQICNNYIQQLNIPVILIYQRFDGIPNFINEIQQEIVVLVDEFEKIYSDRDHSVLTIMDGALDNGFRRTFLLTTNELYINENMIQRPGRIRYLKRFANLTKESVLEIIDDKLVHPELKTVTVDFIMRLETITVDIVKAVIEEVNIHQEDPESFKDVFNIKLLSDKHNVYKIVPGSAEEQLVASSANVWPAVFDQDHVEDEDDFEINGRFIGTIINVTGDNRCAVKVSKEDGSEEIVHYVIEKARQYHYAF